MKILIVHNKYQHAGGEDVVVVAEKKVLASYGHDVRVFYKTNDEIVSILDKVKVSWMAAYSSGACEEMLSEIKSFDPHIVHVHNFFPLLSPSIYDACVATGVPVVQTLHNYRLICPNGLLLREGKICELCVGGSAYNGTRYACYRHSHIGSFFVSRMVDMHRRSGTWNKKVDCFIALTEFSRLKFIQGGLPSDKIRIKPNFYSPAMNYEPPKVFNVDTKSSYALFVGRLSDEKGIRTLVTAWEDVDYPLHIAGVGPLLDMIRVLNNSNITCLGHISSVEMHHEMLGANFLVFPSEWYETFGMVSVEAFAHGLPVISSRLGVMKDIISDGNSGLHFEAGNPVDLAEKVNYLIASPDKRAQMARYAYRVYKEKYTAEINYRILMAIYTDVITSYALHYS